MYFEQSLWVWNPYTYTAATVDYGTSALVARLSPWPKSDEPMQGHVKLVPIFFTPKG